ncbi:MAG TPA: pitrilysin family protein [Candidatus Kapabacteria bacterium]|nr:pitrilysin family protein [Candidatus Kapabacteria bacterium]
MSQNSPAQVDRSKQPAPDPAPTATFPHYDEFKLKNGLKVFFVKDDRALITFRLLVRGGNGADGDLPGLADAVADQMVKGTRSRTSLEFAKLIDFIGGSINASASADAISVTAGGLRKHMTKILDLFADAVKNPVFPDDELAKYVTEQTTGLKSQKARAEFLAEYGVNKVLYGETAYGRMPSEEALKHLSSGMLKQFHSVHFVPGNATLAVIGSTTREELEPMLEQAFGDWAAGPVPSQFPPNFPELKGRRIVLVDRPTAVQSAIRVLGKGPEFRDPDRPKAFVLNSILGGGTGLGNRLAMNLRETHAYTYTPYSGFDANYYRGHFTAAADVRNAVTDSALKEMFYEIDRIQTQRVPDDELQRNIQSSVGGFLMSVADATTTAIRVQSIDFYGLPKDYYEKLTAAYGAVTPDDVMRLAKKYLNNDDLTVVVVGKASEVKSKLDPFGTVEVWNSDLMPVDNGDAMKGAKVTMTAEQAWEKLLTAMGGKKKLRSVKSIQSTAKIGGSVAGHDLKGTVKKVEMAPNKVYSYYDFGLFKQEMVSDGKVVRRSSGGPLEELPPDQRDKVLEDSHILNEAYLEELKGKLNMVGMRSVNGRQAMAVEVNYPKNGTVIYYLNPETFLPLAVESTENGVVSYDDWHDEGGIMLAHKVSFEPQPGSTIMLTDFSYVVDGKVDEALFRKKQ